MMIITLTILLTTNVNTITNTIPYFGEATAIWGFRHREPTACILGLAGANIHRGVTT